MKSVPEYEGLYSVTKDGRVWSHSSEKWIAIAKGKRGKGYLFVRLYKNNKGRAFYVHTLVAKVYVKNPKKKRTVNHKDGDVENNFHKNLEWATHQEQQDHAWQTGLTNNHGERCGTAKLTNDEALELKRLHAVGGYTQYALAEKFGINQSQVSRILSGARRAKQHLGVRSASE